LFQNNIMEEELQNLLKQKMYSFIAVFVAMILLVISILISNRKQPVSLDPVEKYFEAQTKIIESENKTLQNKIDSLCIQLEKNNKKLDVISKTKTQIKYVYISDLKKIDALNTNGIIKEFDAFFSKGNPKQ